MAEERIRFNPFSAEFKADPYGVYARLREREPVHRVMGIWVLTRYEDIVAVLRDGRFASTVIPELIRRYKAKAGRDDLTLIDRFISKAIVFTEDPDHARLRRLVNGAFGAAAVEAERPRIERIVTEQMERLRERGEMDVVQELAENVPLAIACERLGIGRDMYRQVATWTHEVRFLLDPGMMRPSDYEHVHQVLSTFFEYLAGMLEARRREPGSDLLSQLLAARHGADRLSDEEILALAVVSFVAGHETTKYLISNGVRLLVEHPEQADQLRGDPGLLPNAVDEILRYDAPLQQTKRIATANVTVGGEQVKTGEQVLICFGAGNRDPARFPDPDRFDIRRNAKGNLGLGHGMRGCLGGTLAHVEMQQVLRAFLTLKDVQHVGGPLDWQDHSLILRGLKSYPVRFRASS